MKQQLVFYRTRNDLPTHLAEGRVIWLTTHDSDVVSLITDWANGKFRTLYMPRGRTTGWRTTLTPDDAVVHFIGQGWDPADIAQGVNRLSPLAKCPAKPLHHTQVGLCSAGKSFTEQVRAFAAEVKDVEAAIRSADADDEVRRLRERVAGLSKNLAAAKLRLDRLEKAEAGWPKPAFDIVYKEVERERDNPFVRVNGKLQGRFDSVSICNKNGNVELTYWWRGKEMRVDTQHSFGGFTANDTITLRGFTGYQGVKLT